MADRALLRRFFAEPGGSDGAHGDPRRPITWPVFEAAMDAPFGLSAPSGSAICAGLEIFHDATLSLPNWLQRREMPGGPGLRLLCYRFDGRFLSLAFSLPREITQLWSPEDRLDFTLTGRASQPVALQARLNLAAGERQGQIGHHRILHGEDHRFTFPLHGLNVPPAEADGLWLDLIFRAPAMTEIDLGAVRAALCDDPPEFPEEGEADG